MKWLKDLLFNKNLKSRLNNTQLIKKDGKNESNYIGILVDEDAVDNPAALNKVIKEWEKKGKKVEKIAFLNVKELEEGSTDSFCLKQINWFEIPKGEVIEVFLNRSYDILITINPSQHKFINYMNAASLARFKIGLTAEELEYNNLIIDCEKPSHIQTIFRDIQITLDKLAI